MICNFYVLAGLLVLGATLLSVLGLLATRKVVNFEKLRSSHDVGGYLLSVVGTLYAVLLGLVVVDSMQQFQNAREVTERETNTLADIFILANRLPEPTGSRVKKICSEYADQVINTEWSQMHRCTYCPIAREMAVDLMTALIDFEPRTENQKALYPQMLQEASQFWQSRQARINIALKGVPAIEWMVLITGAFITIFFTYFFGLEDLKLQLIMTAMVAMLISLNLMLVLYFGYPFGGNTSIQTDSFESVQCIFKSQAR
jgi:hypothetical protein